MQFFHLFSFVAVASYAAALPQPAGLSEKYSNNVDATLASGLEARSYQPGSNSQGDSATLMLLKRQDNSGSGQPPSPASFNGAAPNRLYNPFDRTETTSANISTTIDNVGDDGVPKMLAKEEEVPEIYVAGVRAGARVGGNAGALLTRYLRRAQYVILAIGRWRELNGNNIFSIIRSVLGEDEYSRLSKPVIRRDINLNDVVQDKVMEANDTVSNIEKNIGTHIENLKKIQKSLRESFNHCILLLGNLRSILENRSAGQTLYGYLSKAMTSLDKFIADQASIYGEIIKELEAAPSQ
ncbi:hypothetical protein BASA50_003883 [Batrachochytrium salamandrivorans]|uniref:Uncharacterized protein n=1 Tax=Batrachochytrium salamandrivorans TaxID=1357716 RepID=A0ABQ8FHB8_9FUNG|nr:hypothetical protein BASA60_001711 [Batrachochytrium salamandrivorans]KAH6597765.1 hypothetical protein BASA61_003029 [Batrachochytrium salamandrivorans]KAH6598269.1 hypothetical protein BASA50_003883 [Batrachochytrium salamandrivorans]KAH9266000.1 hypothetical protein BASA84_001344 [Batrachochytrium salamandrivorans]KAH9276050.1 hypothetical protein BASA83_001323 [Batrachochytrium salamandrivorans]